MNVDREQQAVILQILFDAYPWKTKEASQKIYSMLQNEKSRTIGNLLYLQMHGLISECIEIKGTGYESVTDSDGMTWDLFKYYDCPSLTEKGIDFLMGDEGLSSVLNTKRIVIEEVSLRYLIEQFILRSAIADDRKPNLIQEMKQIPLKVLINWITKQLDISTPL